MEKARILLAEDDPNLSMVLQDYLEMLGYSTHLSTNGEEGYQAFESDKFDLCIFDVMMPKMDGFTLAEKIRKEKCRHSHYLSNRQITERGPDQRLSDRLRRLYYKTIQY